MASGLAARNGGWLGLGALVAILLLGLGLRIGEAWDGRAPVYDAQAYAAIAANLEEGNGFTVGAEATQPSSNYSPGLPLFVAAAYAVAGGVHERLARVVLAAIGTLSVLFAYLIGRRLNPRLLNKGLYRGQNSARVWPALVGALVVAVYPALLEYQGMLMSEPLAATLLSGGVLGVLWAWEGGWARWLPPGALFGALALVRPEYLGVAALVALVVLAREVRLDWRGSLLRAAVFLAAALVVIAPWTIRNAAALDRFVPISTGGGQVLYAGTYLPSDGDPEKVGAEVVAENPHLFAPNAAQELRLEQILARLAHARYPGMETDRALSKMGKEQLWDDISGEPGEYAGFVAKKMWRIWSHGPRDVMREPAWEALHWALVALGLLGLAILAWQRRWEALLLATIFLAITAISALLVASPRRVLVLVPLIAALAAVAVQRVASIRGYSHHKSPVAPARPDSLSAP
jgi:4-amino-4-deoxy-L-arabinose transferase-like glycosyltransferase